MPFRRLVRRRAARKPSRRSQGVPARSPSRTEREVDATGPVRMVDQRVAVASRLEDRRVAVPFSMSCLGSAVTVSAPSVRQEFGPGPRLLRRASGNSNLHDVRLFVHSVLSGSGRSAPRIGTLGTGRTPSLPVPASVLRARPSQRRFEPGLVHVAAFPRRSARQAGTRATAAG